MVEQRHHLHSRLMLQRIIAAAVDQRLCTLHCVEDRRDIIPNINTQCCLVAACHRPLLTKRFHKSRFHALRHKKLIVINTPHEPKLAHLEAAEAHGQVVQPPHKDKLVVHACVVQEQPMSSIAQHIGFNEAVQSKRWFLSSCSQTLTGLEELMSLFLREKIHIQTTSPSSTPVNTGGCSIVC